MWGILGLLQLKCNMEVKKEAKLEVTTLNSLILRGLQNVPERGAAVAAIWLQIVFITDIRY